MSTTKEARNRLHCSNYYYRNKRIREKDVEDQKSKRRERNKRYYQKKKREKQAIEKTQTLNHDDDNDEDNDDDEDNDNVEDNVNNDDDVNDDDVNNDEDNDEDDEDDDDNDDLDNEDVTESQGDSDDEQIDEPDNEESDDESDDQEEYDIDVAKCYDDRGRLRYRQSESSLRMIFRKDLPNLAAYISEHSISDIDLKRREKLMSSLSAHSRSKTSKVISQEHKSASLILKLNSSKKEHETICKSISISPQGLCLGSNANSLRISSESTAGEKEMKYLGFKAFK